MDINETDNDNKSWSLFGSSDHSISSDQLQDNFEEVSFPMYSDNSNEDASYELIEADEPQEKDNIRIRNIEETVQPDLRVEASEQPTPEEPKKSLTSYITEIAETMLNSDEKKQEIKRFESLLRKFDKWLLENKHKHTVQDRGCAQNIESGGSGISICKFLVHNSNINAFVLPFLDVYANIIVTKQAYKNKIQSLCAEFLREAEPESFVGEYNQKNRNHHKKLIFKFPRGTTKFCITIGLDFRLRLNHYITLCTIIEEKFLTMGAFLSFWAYKRKIFNDKFLNPYALYFMIIYFLMTQEPFILPRFNDDELYKMNTPNPLFSGSRGQKKSFIIYKQKRSPNENTVPKRDNSQNVAEEVDCSQVNLEELVTRFFYMYGYEVPKMNKTFSIKRGYPVDSGKRVTGYSLEDPFNPQYDLCKNLNDDRCLSFKAVKSEFERAFSLISEGKIQHLCQE